MGIGRRLRLSFVGAVLAGMWFAVGLMFWQGLLWGKKAALHMGYPLYFGV